MYLDEEVKKEKARLVELKKGLMKGNLSSDEQKELVALQEKYEYLGSHNFSH